MSLEQLKAFLAKVEGDPSLQENLKAAKSPDEVLAIAKEHGHEFTADKISPQSSGIRRRGWWALSRLITSAVWVGYVMDGQPGLMATWPTLPRHPRDVERIADGCANHSLDAVRYGVMWWRAKWKTGRGPLMW